MSRSSKGFITEHGQKTELDLKMPKLSGQDVLKEIRKIRPYVLVIIYTNFSEFADIKALANIGIDGYVNKGPDADLENL